MRSEITILKSLWYLFLSNVDTIADTFHLLSFFSRIHHAASIIRKTWIAKAAFVLLA